MRRDITVGDFMYRKQLVVEREWERIDENLAAATTSSASAAAARFLSPHEIAVGERRSCAGDDHPHRHRLVARTGRRASRSTTTRVCDSDTILSIDRIPRSLAVVGAGVIGCEYASIFAALGVEVHLIDGRTALLPLHRPRDRPTCSSARCRTASA